MDKILYYVFHCRSPHCSTPMMLQTEMLRRELQCQELLSMGGVSLGLVCPRCKQARNYSIDTPLSDRDSQRRSGAGIPADARDGLGCGRENCRTRVLLFAQSSDTTTTEDLTGGQSTWKVGEDLHCPGDHEILTL